MRSKKNVKKKSLLGRLAAPQKKTRKPEKIERRGRSRKEQSEEYDDRKHRNKPKQMSEGKKRLHRLFNRIFLLAFSVWAVYAAISYFRWINIVRPMMNNQASVIVDASGNVLQTVGGEQRRENVDLSRIPDNLKNAYIDIEDERFYSHKGVDIKRTVAATGTYITHFGKSSFGGSTITQQLVKNLTGNDETKISRKFEEWFRASEIEAFCSKDEILQAYFNVIYVAPNTYGVQAGSNYYFDKNVEELDLAECAFLAGINNSPNSYNPFGERDTSVLVKNRTKTVLKKMRDLNHISQEDYEAAVQEAEDGLKFKKGKMETESDGVYSYHCDSVISEVISDISKKKHIDPKFAKNYVYMGGLKIYSTEDTEIQKTLENEYEKSKYVITSTETGNKSQSAMVIMNHTNGQVVACVGGLGKKTTVRGFNRATQACRQTGSASKPLAVLVPGITEKIITPATMYNDEATTFNDGSPDGYSPTNNENYIGEITVRRAVESSQNIPFVKMMEQITPKKSIKYLKKMGITSLQDEDESLMLALGGLKKGVTPLEMAGAYATIANDGTYIEPTFYTKIENDKGKTVLKSEQKQKKVFSPEVAYILKQLLRQPVEGDNGTAQSCKMEGRDVAAKTGTTNNNYDKWLCGFTTYYTAVTWYGYDNNESIQYSGKSPAIKIWSAVMQEIHKGLPKTEFAQNTKVSKATICAKTGKTATGNCNDVYTEYFLQGTVPDQCTTCKGGSRTTSTPKKTTPTTNTNSNTNNNTNINTSNKASTTNNIDNTKNTMSNTMTNTTANTVSANTTNTNAKSSNKASEKNTTNNVNNANNEDEEDDDYDLGP